MNLTHPVKKAVLASSATVYGNQSNIILSESMCPNPINHYGASKLAMENMARTYYSRIPIIITRPFNYTGLGHSTEFVIPKIVSAFKSGQKALELGNIDVYREFNDVRDICEVYYKLLMSDYASEIVNISSHSILCLSDVLKAMRDLAGYEIDVSINPKFVRKNEIKSLKGDNKKLNNMIDYKFRYGLSDTLEWMYES
jgi:nucleoside-diphosphate-sugar epimerase